MNLETIARSHAELGYVRITLDRSTGDIAIEPYNGASDFPPGATHYRIFHAGTPPAGTFPLGNAQTQYATPLPPSFTVSVVVYDLADAEIGRIDATYMQW